MLQRLYLHKQRGHHEDLNSVLLVRQSCDVIPVNRQHMVVVHRDEVVIVVEADGFCTRGVAVTTGDVVGNDVKLGVLDHVVATDAHEVVSHPIKGQVVGISSSSTCSGATLGGALPFGRFTCTGISSCLYNYLHLQLQIRFLI